MDADGAAATARSPRRPRRGVVLGSFGALVAGSILASTALPALATSQVVTPSAVLSLSHTQVVPAPASAVPSTTVRRVAAGTGARAAASATPPRQPRATSPSPRAVAPAASAPRAAVVPAVAPVTTTTVATPPVRPTPRVTLKLGANIAPSPNFLVAGTGQVVNGAASFANPCVTPQAAWPIVTNDPGCTDYVLQAINNARAVEGVRAMTLPSNWYSLTTPQQLFVVADLERVDRGLSPFLGLNAALSSAAQSAALRRADPDVAKGFPIGNDAQGLPGMGGAWSSGFSVLVADYFWMYADGWGGKAATSNVACTSPGAAGCWAHREELLGSAPGYNPGVGLACTTCEMGTGFAIVNGSVASFVDLVEVPAAGALPPMEFTWARDVAPFLA